ncbi:MAG: bifunctional UDP-sugar hydrolase/5'-nucleotidase [Tumebacillaceae bacterium]
MTKTLTILHTNDLHSTYSQWLRLAVEVRRRKKELEAQGRPMLLLEGGDHLDMSVVECLLTEGQVNLDMYAELGYQATAVGNNELMRFTLDQVRAISGRSTVPWVLANLREINGATVGGMKASVKVDLGDGLIAGVIGITDLFGDLYENYLGLKNTDTVATVREEATRLRSEGASVIVLLSHAGMKQDQEQLAPSLSGMVDVIVGGHSHTVLQEPITQSGVIIVQAGALGRFLGELTLELDEATGKVVGHEGKLHPIDPEGPTDVVQEEILAHWQTVVESKLNEVLVTLDTPLSHTDLIRELAVVMRDFYQADLGAMFGATAQSGFPAGPVTVGDVYQVLQSFVCVSKLEMKGSQLPGLLQEARNPEITERQIFGLGIRPKGLPIGTIEFAGLTYDEVDGEFVNLRVNGEPLDPERTYSVGGGEHLSDAKACGYPSLEGTKMTHVDDYYYVKDAYIESLRRRRDAQSRPVRR